MITTTNEYKKWKKSNSEHIYVLKKGFEYIMI